MRAKHAGIIGILTVALLAAFLFSLLIGRYPIYPRQVLLLFDEITGGASPMIDDITRMVFWQTRLPRLLAAALIGAALSVSGAVYQGIFVNPMVSPDILGAISGASFGAALGILLGFGMAVIQGMALAGGLLAVAIAFFVSQTFGGSIKGGTLMLVLAGMVVNSLFSAGISMVKYVGDPYDTLPALTFWLMGSLTYVGQKDIFVLLWPFLAGMIPLMLFRWKINILCFSEEEAQSMGMATKRIRSLLILCATLLTCSSVAVGGMIGWVGLIVPHICRTITGPDYKKLLPVTALAGALFLILVDDAARCISPQEIPLGVLTAIIGAPVFLFQLYRRKRF